MPPALAEQVSPLAHRIKDAAVSIGLSVSKLYQLAAAGEITIIRIAGRSLIEHAELLRLMEEARKAGGSIETGRATGARKVRAIRAERAKAGCESPAATLARRRRRARPTPADPAR